MERRVWRGLALMAIGVRPGRRPAGHRARCALQARSEVLGENHPANTRFIRAEVHSTARISGVREMSASDPERALGAESALLSISITVYLVVT